MLPREQANEPLKKFRGDPSRKSTTLQLFPSRLTRELYTWVRDRRGGDPPAIGQRLDELDLRRLAKTFRPISASLSEPLARWWQWSQCAPYQRGWQRRGFRTGRPADSLAGRLDDLGDLLRFALEWPQDAGWFAAWSIHLHPPHALSGLLAAEMSNGRLDIADTLIACAFGRHPIGGVSATGLRALLGSDQPDCWESVATLLRNAGRQEGLRSAVLEAVDLAHPGALRRILDVVVEDDLTRFAGTVRAVGLWFGEELDVRKGKSLTPLLSDLAACLASPSHARALAGSGGAPQRFIALWASAFDDAHRAISIASVMLSESDPQSRRVAARLLAELGLPAARAELRRCLADPDLNVYATAVSAWPTHPHSRDTDARLEAASVAVLLDRVRSLGKPTPVETGVIGARTLTVGSAHAADVILANLSAAAAPAEALAAASPDGRFRAVRRMAAAPAAYRAALFGFLTDASSAVRGQAFEALRTLPATTPDETRALEHALRRKASDLRQFAITLLLRQSRGDVVGSVGRLANGTAEQQRAALEIAKQAVLPLPAVNLLKVAEAGTVRPEAASAPTIGATRDGVPPSLRFRTEDRTPSTVPPVLPPDRFAQYHTGCRRVVTSLRAWLSEHADTEVRTRNGVELMSNIRWLPSVPEGERFPLPEIVQPWWDRVGPSLTDGGLEMALLHLGVPRTDEQWAKRAARGVYGVIPAVAKESPLMWAIIGRVADSEFRTSWIDLLLDAVSQLLREMPVNQVMGEPEVMARRGRRLDVDQWGQVRGSDARTAFLDFERMLLARELTAPQLDRLWRLARYRDEPEGVIDVFDGPKVTIKPPRSFDRTSSAVTVVLDQPVRMRPSPELVGRAFEAGVARRGDLLDTLLDLDDTPTRFAGIFTGRHRDRIGHFTARRLPGWAASPAIQAEVAVVREAAVAAELGRGDLPGPLTQTARRLRSAYGVHSLARVLHALGSRPLTRGYSWTESRDSSLSHLARIHQPAPGDDLAAVREAFTRAGISDRRVIEYAVYAPHWAALIEQYLGWPGFESAVWWLHAHTKDESWTVDQDIRDEWKSAVSQRTPLDAVDLVRGAADVRWAGDVITELGTERFATVLAGARYASSAGGHKRADLFARALLGQVSEADLLQRIQAKRHQDSLRAFGLLPLSGRDDPALLARYEMLRGFVATDRTSGSQRRASETTAVTIGLENLARTAGYRDPQQLVWAMEAEAVRDLADGPVTAAHGDLTVTLTLDTDGTPVISVDRAGKPLKSVPAKSAKVPAVASLSGRAAALRKQAARMRRSLEDACVSGQSFRPAEVQELLGHPVLAPMLRDLVLVSEEGVVGLACTDASHLIGPGGRLRPTDGSPLRIAHPVDLNRSGEWPDLQHEMFSRRRSQPFRQLFRELYTPTASELDDGPASRRYAGHQVESSRAAGIFTSRGWVADFEIGFARTFHQEKITARCSVLSAFGTAADVEDATVEDVTFHRTGTWNPMPLGDVPPRVFSEAMRDLDLVVSVAHSGGVDPETSEASTDMRRRLVEETADALGLDNVEVSGHHARIRGKLGTYSVQLGSGQVHRIPGNAICIIPVSAQHRGRVFLPFLDDDPRTAEVISKVLLLARDHKISDPTILEQLA